MLKTVQCTLKIFCKALTNRYKYNAKHGRKGRNSQNWHVIITWGQFNRYTHTYTYTHTHTHTHTHTKPVQLVSTSSEPRSVRRNANQSEYNMKKIVHVKFIVAFRHNRITAVSQVLYFDTVTPLCVPDSYSIVITRSPHQCLNTVTHNAVTSSMFQRSHLVRFQRSHPIVFLTQLHYDYTVTSSMFQRSHPVRFQRSHPVRFQRSHPIMFQLRARAKGQLLGKLVL